MWVVVKTYQVHKEFSLPSGNHRKATFCCRENECISIIESNFRNVTAFVCQLPFLHCNDKCLQTSMVPLILYVIALKFLHSSVWLVWAVNICTTTHPSSVSPRTRQKVWQLFSRKKWNLTISYTHKVYSVIYPQSYVWILQSPIRPGPLIPVTLDREVHNKSITHSFKMKIKRASD